MVHKIVRSKNRVFVESLIITLLILLIGFFIGFYVESYRNARTSQAYADFEVDTLDLRLQNYYFQLAGEVSCDMAISENLAFADRIYEKGLELEKYEEESELLRGPLLNEKKKYVLLKTELWLNSILIKQRCGDPFHTLVYFYTQNPSAAKKTEQDAISKTLEMLKSEYGNNIILLPVAGDLELESVNMQLRLYNITYLPTILLDEETKLEGFYNLDELESYIK